MNSKRESGPAKKTRVRIEEAFLEREEGGDHREGVSCLEERQKAGKKGQCVVGEEGDVVMGIMVKTELVKSPKEDTKKLDWAEANKRSPEHGLTPAHFQGVRGSPRKICVTTAASIAEEPGRNED